MLSRRSLFAGLSGLLAFFGFSRPQSLAKEMLAPVIAGEKTISLHLDALHQGEIWRRLTYCIMEENGHTTVVNGDELRDLAGAMLRAADAMKGERTFMFRVPQDAAIEGRYGDFVIGFEPPVNGQSPGVYGTNSATEIGVILEPVSELRDRADAEIGAGYLFLDYDEERRLWFYTKRKPDIPAWERSEAV